MNKTFIDLARIYFPNAKIVIDRYHFVRQKENSKNLDENSYSKQRTLFSEWLSEVENSGIGEFKAAITAFRNNYKYILNSLQYRHISNAPTEGLN